MKFDTIIFERVKGVGIITLNRPERLNAMSPEMYPEIHAAIQEVAKDKTVKVLVLTGAGRAFCVGGDFRGDTESLSAPLMQNVIGDPAGAAEVVRSYTKPTSLALQRLDIPTIAMVNGVANGAGFSWAQACDLRVGSENARFRSTWNILGLAPAFGDSWLLPRIVGLGRALDIIMTGRWVDAEEALQMGLLNRLVPAGKLKEETMRMAEQLAQRSGTAHKLCKTSVYFDLNVDFESALDVLALAQALAFTTQEFREIVAATQEKKGPLFERK
jgi:2-(1,2-epoxy-1,2-dihydrophenyl)acetyl-CoA isomerase